MDGEEVTTRNGHFLVAGLPAGEWIDWRYRATEGSFDAVTRRIHRLGALVIGAHPYCPFVGCSWKFGYGRLDAVEVWNGPWTLDDELSVATWDGLLVENARNGRWLPAVGNSDAHGDPQVVGLPQTAVLAADLTRDAVLDGVRAGRSWIAESHAVGLEFTATAADTVTWTTTPQVSGYIRAEIRRTDPALPQGAMVAMTNPIFLGRLR